MLLKMYIIVQTLYKLVCTSLYKFVGLLKDYQNHLSGMAFIKEQLIS